MQWKYDIFLATEYCRRVVYNLGVTLVGRDGVKLSTVVLSQKHRGIECVWYC